MAIPTVVGVGTPDGSASSVSPTVHASTVTGDDLWLAVEANGNQNPSSISGYTLVDESVGSGAGSTGLSIWHRKADESAADNPTIADVGNHLYAVILTTRGGHATTPVDASADGREESTDTSGSSPGLTTTADDCLVVDFVSTAADDAAPTWSDWANASLANLSERFEGGTTAGGGGGIAINTGEKAAAGTVDATTMTTPADHKAFVMVAIAPAAGGAGELAVDNAGTGATVPGADLAPSGAAPLSVDVAGVAAAVPGADLAPSGAASLSADVAGSGATVPGADVSGAASALDAGFAGTGATVPGADVAASGSAQLDADVAGTGATIPGSDLAASGSVSLAVDVAGAGATVPGADLTPGVATLDVGVAGVGASVPGSDLAASGSAQVDAGVAGTGATVPGGDLQPSGAAPLAVDVAGAGASIPGADLAQVALSLSAGVAGTGATVPGADLWVRGRVWAVVEFAAAAAPVEYSPAAAVAEFEGGSPSVAEFDDASRLSRYASPTRLVDF